MVLESIYDQIECINFDLFCSICIHLQNLSIRHRQLQLGFCSFLSIWMRISHRTTEAGRYYHKHIHKWNYACTISSSSSSSFSYSFSIFSPPPLLISLSSSPFFIYSNLHAFYHTTRKVHYDRAKGACSTLHSTTPALVCHIYESCSSFPSQSADCTSLLFLCIARGAKDDCTS